MNERIAPAMTYGGGTGAVIFGFDANTIGMVAGVIIGVLGLLLTWYYKREENKRRQAAHDLHMTLSRSQRDMLMEEPEADE